jgi:hypothetical protein
MALTSSETCYTIIVSGESFKFTKEQLESDPDNEFTRYFFGSKGREASPRLTLFIEAEPKLFTLIQAHLRGYPVLPIPDRLVPVYMTKNKMLTSFRHEASKYRLSKLIKYIDEYTSKGMFDKSQISPTSPWSGPRAYQLGVGISIWSSRGFL